MRIILLSGLLLLSVAGIWFLAGHGRDVESARTDVRMMRGGVAEVVTAEPVRYREITDTLEAIGTTYANESVSIISKVTDTISRVHFEDGDHVKAGDILVEMTNSEETALLDEAKANLDEARRQLNRQLDLGEKGLAAKSTIDEAAAKKEAAEARFNAITARMNDRLIRAPFSGILGFRKISPGTLLTTNTVITTLDDISLIKLDFSVPETFLGRIKPGFRIIAGSDAWKDVPFEGEINSISSRVDPVTRAVTVRATIRNPDELLRPGMLMTVRVVTDVRQALVVPESAFIQTGSESYVFIAGDDGLAHRRVIQIGSRKYGYVEVLEGLKEGELIITEGGFKLRDNSPYQLDEKSEMNFSLSAGVSQDTSI